MEKPLLAAKKNIIKIVTLKRVRLTCLLLCGLVAWQYFQTKIYIFPEPTPFSGDHLYNPYAGIRNGTWVKGNFHAHSKSWFGLTDGHQSPQDMVNVYRNHGYDVASLSDYHKINNAIYTSGNISVPVYEHGMNLNKVHHLGIGAEKVTFNDVMLWQSNSVKQFFIDQMRQTAPVVCVNHPGLSRGHDTDDLAYLTGYDCMEVLNRHRKYFEHWDAALSAGRPVWILGNDDCHDLVKEDVAKSWNLISVTERTSDNVISAIKRGSSFAVRRTISIENADSLAKWAARNNGNIVQNISTKGHEVFYKFNTIAKQIRLIGQGGNLVRETHNTDSIHYAFTADDTYIRAEIELPEITLYLNPVVRYKGNIPPANYSLAKVDFVFTLLLRLSILIAFFGFIVLIFPELITWLTRPPKKLLRPSYDTNA